MALVVQIEGGGAAECRHLKVTGAPVEVSGGVATVGPGPYFPYAIGGGIRVDPGDGSPPQHCGCVRWGLGAAITDPATGVTTLGADRAPEPREVTFPGVVRFAHGRVTDRGNGHVEVSFE